MLLLLTLVNKFDVTLITGWNKVNCHSSVQLDQIEWMILNMIKELEERCIQPSLTLSQMIHCWHEMLTS
jgi:hypothetical protein